MGLRREARALAGQRNAARSRARPLAGSGRTQPHCHGAPRQAVAGTRVGREMRGGHKREWTPHEEAPIRGLMDYAYVRGKADLPA